MTSLRERRNLHARRRYAFAYVASIVIHLIVGSFFAVRFLMPPGGAPAANEAVAVTEDRAAPSRLMSAFPEGVVVHRVGLAKAVEETRLFLHEEGLAGRPGVS